MKPYFELSKRTVLTQYEQVKDLVDLVSYSSKTNPRVAKILEEETDSFFSIHLVNELKNVQDKSRVLFLAQAWNLEQIDRLLDAGVRFFAVDNLADLEILKQYLLDNLQMPKIKLLLRLKLRENSLRTEKYFVFGMRAAQIITQVAELRSNEQLSSKIESLGIHFHRKTQNMSEWNYQHELEQLFDKSFFESIDFVNMGGGLPSVYANTNVKVVGSIFRKITDFRSWLSELGIKLIIEPGRFIAAPAVTLHCQVIGLYDHNIIVNVSVYNTDLDALIVPVKLLVRGEGSRNDEDFDAYVIKGVTPCSMDLFRYRVYLKDIKVGDELVFENAGAYNFSTQFCDLETIETRFVQ